jgi:hypothetical protein
MAEIPVDEVGPVFAQIKAGEVRSQFRPVVRGDGGRAGWQIHDAVDAAAFVRT